MSEQEVKLEQGTYRINAYDELRQSTTDLSIALSLKRIADHLDSWHKDGLPIHLGELPGVETLIGKIANTPTNQYGEGFSEAIQNSIARGLRGLNTGDR